MSTNSDDLADSISRLSLIEESEAAILAGTLNVPTTAHATEQLPQVRDEFPGIRENSTFSSNDVAVFADNARRLGTHFDEGSTQHGAPFPVFLSDSNVGGALQRANALHLQRHGFPAVLSPTLDQLADRVGDAGRPERLSYPDPHAHEYFSSAPAHARESSSRDPLPVQFTEPDQATASVLAISKRPRLRPKDIAHRQSLEAARSAALLPSDVETAAYDAREVVLAKARHDMNSEGFPSPHYELVYGRSLAPSPQRPVDNFMALLRFGQRKVGVTTSLRMSVHELQETAAQIAGVAPGDIALMIGEVYLPPTGVLGDYVLTHEMRGTIISVVSSVGIRPVSPTPRPPTTHDRTRSPDSSSSSLSGGDISTVFRINLVYEDGNVVTQPVAPLMLVRQVRDMVALSVGASPDSVTLIFNGVALTLDRRLSDPPPLLHNSYVYIVRVMPPYYNRDWTIPPRSTPPPPPPPVNGPALPPGFVRLPHSHTPSSAPAPAPSVSSRGRSA
jgi:hypothetical protein